MTNKGFFITGTDTETGKTFVTAFLASYYRQKKINVGIYKPIQSGAVKDKKTKKLVADDLEFIIKHTKISSKKTKCSVLLEPPLAPQQAADISNLPHIDPDLLLKDYKNFSAQNDFTLVEGAGGLFVPIKKGYFMIDLIKELKLPVIIVSNAGLGTINHTCLTIEALKKRKIRIKGIIFNEPLPLPKSDISQKLNQQVIEEITRIKVLAYLPYQKKIDIKKLLSKYLSL